MFDLFLKVTGWITTVLEKIIGEKWANRVYMWLVQAGYIVYWMAGTLFNKIKNFIQRGK